VWWKAEDDKNISSWLYEQCELARASHTEDQRDCFCTVNRRGTAAAAAAAFA